MPESSRIADALEATKQIVSDLDSRSREADRLLTEIRHDLKTVSEITNKLSVLVWTGNGNDSLMTRVTILERTSSGLSEKLKTAEAEKVKFRTAFLTSVVAALASLGSALIAFLK